MIQTVGSPAQVFHGTATHTSGGLTKKDLIINERGRIVSRLKHEQGKRNPWCIATSRARQDLGIEKGEMLLQRRGSELTILARDIYKKIK
jgi:hypothetical protein